MATRPEIIVCTLGTRGDILPFLALASPLIQRGFRTTILSNANWEALAREAGADFFAIAEKDPPQDKRDHFQFFLENTFPSFQRCFDFVKRRVQRGAKCALVYRLNMLGAECAGEQFSLPHIKVALQPSAIRSVERPPWPTARLTSGWLGDVAKRSLIPALYALSEYRYRRHTNIFRSSIGASKTPYWGGAAETERLLLLMCPDWFADPQKDWPSTTRMVGFPFFDRPYISPPIEKFIDRHGSPLVFTPGTGVRDANRLLEIATDVCHATDSPGVFLSDGIPLNKVSSAKLHISGYAELSWLLPKARLIVHHGGIGTTAQAARAGIPQCILPQRFDQPDNAVRVALLGLGAAILSGEPSSIEVVNAVKQLLADEEVQSQVSLASRLIKEDDSVTRACDLIEEIINKPCLSSVEWNLGERI